MGYASFALYESGVTAATAANMEHGLETVVPQWFPVDGGALLVQLARAAVQRALGLPAPFFFSAPWLDQAAAVFVTLTRDGALRGCIGSLTAHRALALDVAENAAAAALRDLRFAPVNAQELPALKVEVSLLTAPVALMFGNEADALAQLCPQFDGVILEASGRRSTFLPQVWEQIPVPRAFLAALKEKTGLPANYWGADVKLSCYRVAKFTE